MTTGGHVATEAVHGGMAAVLAPVLGTRISLSGVLGSLASQPQLTLELCLLVQSVPFLMAL